MLKPGSDWNYALKVDKNNMPVKFEIIRKPWPANNFPFTAANVPLEFRAEGVQIPSWGFGSTGMTDVLPSEDAVRSSSSTRLTLVPMGAARLRISLFPREIAK